MHNIIAAVLVLAFFGLIAYAYGWDRKNPHR